MTKKEAINDLKDFIDTYITVHGEEDTIAVSLDNVDVEALDMAIKALQESILDKLRAEIETKYGQCSICEYDSDYGGKWYQVGDIADILQIIDKYKAESEG